MATVLQTTAIRVQKPWQSSLLLSLGLLSLPISGCALLASSAMWPWLGAISLVAFGSAIATGARDRRRPGGQVTLTRLGIDVRVPGLARTLAVARSEVQSGYEVPLHSSVELLLTGRRKLVIETRDPGLLLEHLGVAVGQRALTMPLRGTIGAFVLGLLTMMLGLLVFGIGYAVVLRALLGVPGVAAALWPLTLLSTVLFVVLAVARFGFPRVVVGADGVRVRGTLAQPFVPYAAITNVLAHPAGVQLALANGTFVQLETYGQSSAQITTLATRIEQGRKACAEEASGKLDVLQRGGRSMPAWRDDLRRIALAPPGFRDHAYSHDDFERILSDPSSPPDQRIGAALALRFADPEARPRIRVAAAASANDDLRDALEACASEHEVIDDEPLHRATARRR